MKELAKTLSAIQRELKAPKGQWNDFSKYHYRNCEDILSAVKPLLPEGYFVSMSDSIQIIGDRFYIVATAFISDGESRIESTGWARECQSKKGMDEAQITGSTSSYARKYALNGLFAIDDTKDADSHDNSQQYTERKANAKQANKAQQLSDIDMQWIDACRADRSVLEQLNDNPEYKAFVQSHLK